MDDERIIPFARRTSGNPPGDDGDELVEPGNTYATARGTRPALALRFITEGGKAFTMPYAYHPIIWAESAELLTLEYPRFFSVILAGKNLGQLESRLCDYRVTWIRQCSLADAERLPAAVTRIARMDRYPSRELID